MTASSSRTRCSRLKCSSYLEEPRLLLRFEAIGSLATGLTATVGGTSLDLPGLSQDFSDAGATFHGITAAWVSVGDKAAYDALATNNSVLLVDLTEEAVRYEVARRPEVLAGMSGNLDVIVDDVYWSYAGLTK